MRILAAVGVLLLVLLVGVTGFFALSFRAVPELDAAEKILLARRDKDAAVAEHLDEYKQQVEKLQADSAKAGLFFTDDADDPTKLKAIEANAGGAQVSWTHGSVLYVLNGRGGPAGAVSSLVRLSAAEPGLIVGKVQVGPESWSAGVSLEPPRPPPSSSDLSSPVPPAICLMRCRQQMARISGLRAEISQLERLIGEVGKFEQGKAKLEFELKALRTDPRRLYTASRELEAFFGSQGVFVEGSYVPDGPTEGTLRPGLSDSTALVSRIPKRWEIGEISPGHARLVQKRD